MCSAGSRRGGPAVSVLLPARDAAPWIAATLASLRRQTFEDFECVVVDDGSRDETPRLVERVAQRDARFQLWRQPARGLVTALETGLDACSGRLVARLDADDIAHRKRLAEQVACLDASPTLAGLGTHVRIFPRATMAQGLRDYESWLLGIDGPGRVRRDALVDCPLPHPTWLIRAEVLRTLRYRERPWPEDWDLLLRLLATGHDLGIVPRRLVGWRDHPARRTRTAPECALERVPALRAHHLAHGLLRQAESYVLWGHGHTGRALRRELEALGRRPSHIVEVHPGRLGQRIHGAPVIPPGELRQLRGERIVCSVAGPAAREQMRVALAEMGFRELEDFVCAA